MRGLPGVNLALNEVVAPPHDAIWHSPVRGVSGSRPEAGPYRDLMLLGDGLLQPVLRRPEPAVREVVAMHGAHDLLVQCWNARVRARHAQLQVEAYEHGQYSSCRAHPARTPKQPGRHRVGVGVLAGQVDPVGASC